jgi:predicted nucleic acid-binding protein
MTRYVLDTSALLTYIENEEGVEKVESLLQKALDEELELYVSTVSCIEVFYISWREQGEDVARERLKLIDDLMVIQEPVEDRLTEIIGEIKATTAAISFADCCIAGLAKSKQATLVHKDPEFEKIKGKIKQLKLPYKRKVKPAK